MATSCPTVNIVIYWGSISIIVRVCLEARFIFPHALGKNKTILSKDSLLCAFHDEAENFGMLYYFDYFIFVLSLFGSSFLPNGFERKSR